MEKDVYAIVLYFDKDTEEKIQEGIIKLAQTTGNNYMIEHSVPPHVTLAMIYSEKEDGLIQEIENFTRGVKQSLINFQAVSSFGTFVLFLATNKDEYLSSLNSKLYEQLSKEYEVADQGNYLPNYWIPHCALGVRFSEEEYEQGCRMLDKQFKFPIVAKATQIVLVKCNPYKEIKKFEIEE